MLANELVGVLNLNTGVSLVSTCSSESYRLTHNTVYFQEIS